MINVFENLANNVEHLASVLVSPYFKFFVRERLNRLKQNEKFIKWKSNWSFAKKVSIRLEKLLFLVSGHFRLSENDCKCFDDHVGWNLTVDSTFLHF